MAATRPERVRSWISSRSNSAMPAKTVSTIATHNRLFDRLADLEQSIRNSVRYSQTVRSLVAGSYSRPENQKASAGS
jgi:hypothetical protein